MHYRQRILAVAAAIAFVAAPAKAQEFTYHNTMSFKMGGALGFAAKLAGGGKDQVETGYLSGHKMRTEMGDNATIIDADAGRFTMINKKNKTYSTMTFEEMAEMMRQMQAQMKDAQKDAKKENPNADVQFKYSADVDATGQSEKIAGYDAKRVVVTLTVDAAARPEGEKDMQQAGSMVILIDTWNSTDAPHAKAMKDFQEEFARKAAKEMGSSMRGMEALFGMYPGAKEGLEAAAKELKKVPGVPVRTSTYMVLVPPGQKLDRALAMSGGKANEKASEEKQGGGGLGGLMGKLKKATAQPSEGGQPQQATQSTIFSMSNTLTDVQAGGVPADAFTVPAGYKQVDPKTGK